MKICEKALLNVPEMMEYTGWGENTVRNALNHPRCTYVVRIGNRLYANRKLLDKYLDSISGKEVANGEKVWNIVLVFYYILSKGW